MSAGPRGATALAVVLAAAIGLAACDDGAEGPSDTGSAPPSTVQEGLVAATAVAAGDCLNGIVIGAAERAEISSARVVSCDAEHALEVYATFALEPRDFELDDPIEYPGRVRVVDAADEGCAARIEEVAADPDEFGLIALWPSEASWTEGDRTVACAVFDPDGSSFDRRQL